MDTKLTVQSLPHCGESPSHLYALPSLKRRDLELDYEICNSAAVDRADRATALQRHVGQRGWPFGGGGFWKAVFECRPAGYWLYMAHVVADTPPLTSSANWQCEKTLTFVNAFPDARQVDMAEVVQRASG